MSDVFEVVVIDNDGDTDDVVATFDTYEKALAYAKKAYASEGVRWGGMAYAVMAPLAYVGRDAGDVKVKEKDVPVFEYEYTIS